MVKQVLLGLLVAPLLASGVSYAAEAKPAGFSRTDNPLVFGAPPRESAEEAAKIYQPVVDHLSKAINKRIVLKYPRTWGVYRTEMINGRYDIVFDGPHFNSYRAEKLQHNILVKLSDNREFVVATLKDEKTATVGDLAGQSLCVQPPPNLATLIALSQFDTSVKKPLLVPMKGWDKVYSGILSGRCTAGAFPAVFLANLDKDGKTKILYKSQPVPEQALSVGPRVSAADQAKIVAALTSPDAAAATEKLRATAKGGEKFVATNNQEYAALAKLLKSEWGFYDN